jgi:hypothetical protein
MKNKNETERPWRRYALAALDLLGAACAVNVWSNAGWWMPDGHDRTFLAQELLEGAWWRMRSGEKASRMGAVPASGRPLACCTC